MEHIFGDDSDYSQETDEQLKQVMLLSELNDEDTLIYGKTGMGVRIMVLLLIRGLPVSASQIIKKFYFLALGT